MRKNRMSKRRRGISMIEVLISLTVLGFGILGAAASQLTAMRFTRDSQLRTEAFYLASQQMESFQSMTGDEIDAIKDLGSYPNDTANPIDPDPNDNLPRLFNRSWDIEDDDPEDGIFTILVFVSWVDGLGNTQTVTLESMKVDS